MNSKFVIGLMILAVVFTEGRYCASDGFWPQTPVFEEASVACDGGYLSRMCMGDMEWGRISDHHCECTPNVDVPVTHNAKRGETIQHQCQRGFLEVTCNMTGTWDVDGIEDDGCFCIRNDGFPMTQTDDYASKRCTIGEAERFCNFGEWDKADYGNCFNYRHECSDKKYKEVLFYISPSLTEHQDVEVCVYAVLPNEVSSVTVDDIKTKGVCQSTRDANDQYRIALDLEPNHYVALIYAHSDHTPVSIPALNRLYRKSHYEYEFIMDSCNNRLETHSSDSYSISLRNSYIWAYDENPLVTIYYTDNLSLKQSQLNLFQRKNFIGYQGATSRIHRVTNLKPFTRYRFYSIVSSRNNPAKQLISNSLIMSTYDTCKDGEWPEVGVTEESKIDCAIGYHAYMCTRQEDFHANFTERRDPCFCPEEVLHGTTYPMTQYDHYAEVGTVRRYCGWKGIWEVLPNRGCLADGPWEAIEDGEEAVLKCDNGGQLTRKCINGVWQEIQDMNCKCASETINGIKWAPANRDEVITHECMSGSITRTCTFLGHWEDPVVNACACDAQDIWEYQEHDSYQTKPCGTEGTEGNTATRYCGYDGFWKEEDLTSCGCDTLTADDITWIATAVNTASWIECEIGAKARICSPYGVWDDAIGTYGCMCAADKGFENTEAGVTATLPCPDDPTKVQTRYCNNAGVWKDIDSFQCYGSCPALGRFPVSLSGTTATIVCEEGGGRILMDCLRKVDANGDFYGEWDRESWRVEGDCLCQSSDAFPSASVNTEAEIICDSGKRTRKCGQFTARWEDPVNHDCMCTVQDAPFPVDHTPLFEETVVDCEVGTRRVYCGEEGHYVNMDSSSCYCGADDGFEQTAVSTTATADCIERGTRSRFCQATGFWSSIDYTQCMCNGFSPITDYLPIDSGYTQSCPVGQYNVTCSATGATTVVDQSCSCEAIEGFPQTPAGQLYEEACGTKEKSAYCNLDGVWTNIHNPCYCEATTEFPSIAYGELADANLPQCYKGYCNPETGMTEINYDGCACEGVDEWPAMQHGENITLPCETGGSRSAYCDMGVLSVNYEDCNCYDENNTEIEVGDYLNFPCMIGFVLKQCRGNNYWYNITDSYCGCSSKDEGLSLFEIVNAGETKTVQCGAGSMSIHCDETGHYDMDSWNNSCKCGEDGIWEETAVDTTVTKQCLSGEGTYSRACGMYGVWDDVVSTCTCPQDGEWSASSAGLQTQVCSDSGITIERMCHEDGSWGTATGSCLDRSCPADGVFPITPHLGSYTHTCGNGAAVIRTCNGGIWSTADWSNCGCAPEDGFVSGEYIDEEVFRSTSSQSCGIGQKTRVCLYGVWQAVNYDDCFCAAQDILPSIQANHAYTHLCGVGSIEAHCNNSGEWVIDDDTCGCAQDAESLDEVVFPATLRGHSVSFSCLSGSMTRTCNKVAQWEAVDSSACYCQDEGWTPVHPTEDSQYACEEGYLTRMCKPNGQWGAQSSASCACSATPSYPRTVVLGTATHQCGEGSTSAVCGINGWEEEVDNGCSCIATAEYPVTPRNVTAEIPCGLYKDGTKTRLCNIHGYWDDEEDDSACVNWCSAVGEWPYTQPDQSVTLPCPEGYTDGSITRYCSPAGLWEAAVSTCIPMKCPAVDGFPLTPIYGIATRDCASGFTGSITRRCVYSEGAAVWSDVEDTCQEAVCTVGDHTYHQDDSITLECGEGYYGYKEQVCHTGVWEVVRNTCTPVVCSADEEHGYPSGSYGDVYNMNCGIDFTGTVQMRCNALQQWEYVTGSCTPIQPTLRCEPADNASNVALVSKVNEQFTIYCTSNVRIREVVNDQAENMNIHVLFDLADVTISYPTTAVFVSAYTVGFIFDGSFPPACEGTLYINAYSFISENNVSFPASTLVSSFATRDGMPLAPPQIGDSAIEIIAVNAAQRTATLKVTLPFSSIYDEAQLVFIRSNLQSQFVTSSEVIVEGAVLNSVILLSWRVRKGDYWSEFAAFTVYQPVALLPPATPIVSSYHATTIEWRWSASESYGLLIDTYHYQVVNENDEVVQEATIMDTSLVLDLEAGHLYRLRVAAVYHEYQVYSDYSVAVLLSSSVFTPSIPLEFTVTPISSSHIHLTWKEPVNCGGASIQYYILRRAKAATHQVIEQVYTVSALTFDLYDIQEAVYLELAAFNGYTSPFISLTFTPVALSVAWTSNSDEGIQFDNAIQIHGEFNYLSIATCTVTASAYPAFIRSHTFTAATSVAYTFQPLMAETTYQVACQVHEVSSEYIIESTFTVATVATADLSPSLIVDGEPTSSITATVQVTTTLLGELTCYVAPYENTFSRPTTYTGFASNWAETQEVESITNSLLFHFPYDVTGMPINETLTYHAWCMIRRAIVVYQDDEETTQSLVFPDYTETGEGRRLLQVTPFELTAIEPAEFSFNVDPSSNLHFTFSQEAQVGEGLVTLLDSKNHLITIAKDDIHCTGNTCGVNLHGLAPKEKYILHVDKNAFVSGEVELEEEVANWFFATGYYRCDTKYVSKGLTDRRVCQCFTVDDKCECECGETSVARYL